MELLVFLARSVTYLQERLRSWFLKSSLDLCLFLDTPIGVELIPGWLAQLVD